MWGGAVPRCQGYRDGAGCHSRVLPPRPRTGWEADGPGSPPQAKALSDDPDSAAARSELDTQWKMLWGGPGWWSGQLGAVSMEVPVSWEGVVMLLPSVC